MAGADFIKTSTGKEPVNATLPVSLVMLRAIRDYRDVTGHIVGFKPAGGIRTAKESLAWLALVKEELGNKWLSPKLFRFGASSLLADIERQLEPGNAIIILTNNSFQRIPSLRNTLVKILDGRLNTLPEEK